VASDTYAPKYRQVAGVLRDRIRSGALAPGDRVPSEAELVAEFGFDRGTVREAVKVLRKEGLVDVIHGRGTFVRRRRLIRRNLIEGLRREYDLAAAGQEPDGGLFRALTGTAGEVDVPTEYSPAAATGDLADAFGVPERTPLLCRRYLHLIDGEPHEVTHSYLLAEMVDGTPLADKGCERPGRGTIGQLALIGVTVDRVVVDFRTWQATPEDVEALAMPEGEPVFGYRRVMYAAGRAVEVGDVASPGDQVIQQVTVEFGTPR
jgi:GntR family transcriptional regulator